MPASESFDFRETAAARRILIVGGYGTFGSRAAERLAREGGFDIVIAGRDRARADEAARALQRMAAPASRISGARLDAASATAADLPELGVGIVINAPAPLQSHSSAPAEAAIAAHAHYVDLADARAFVTQIGTLDNAARAAGVLVVSGASSVPGLSSAIVRHLTRGVGGAVARQKKRNTGPRPADDESELSRAGITREIVTPEVLDIAISPGNSFDPGLATTQSILG